MDSYLRWSNTAALAGTAVVVLWALGADGNWFAGLAAAVVLLALAAYASPLTGRNQRSWPEVEAQLPAGPARPVIFWRPGCVFCLRLKASLGTERRKATWINIWQDRDAAAFVRSHNDGNETVPTVLLDGEVLTNPAPGTVRAALART